MVLSIFIRQILHFLINIAGFIHICAARRFTAQIEIYNQQIIFINNMQVLWQVKSIYYQTMQNLSHINTNCLINKESKNVQIFIFPESLGYCQAQPKPQLSWAEWLYFQLIQPPPKKSSPKNYWFIIILVKKWKNNLVKKKNLVKKIVVKKIGQKTLVQKSVWSQTICQKKFVSKNIW